MWYVRVCVDIGWMTSCKRRVSSLASTWLYIFFSALNTGPKIVTILHSALAGMPEIKNEIVDLRCLSLKSRGDLDSSWLVRHSNGCLFHLLTPETVTIELQETTVDSAWVSLEVSKTLPTVPWMCTLVC